MNNKDFKMIYDGRSFDLPETILKNYTDDYFQLELDLESDIFYELRVLNNIFPNKINESTDIELSRIKHYFNTHKNDFYFYFINDDLIGSSMHIKNQIKCLSIARKYQKMGYGSFLTKFMVNKIFENDYKFVEIMVLKNNLAAINLYKKIGFIQSTLDITAGKQLFYTKLL